MTAQQYEHQLEATSDATGVIRFTFPYPAAANLAVLGSITVDSGPVGQYRASVDGVPAGTWGGAAVFGPLRVGGNQQLVVDGTGVTPNTRFTAKITGTIDDAANVDAAPPADSSSLISVNLSQATTILEQSGLVFTGGAAVPAFVVPAWCQLLAVLYIPTGGSSATGALLQQTDDATGVAFWSMPVGVQQWSYWPVNGRQSSFFLTPLLNQNAGGTLTATVMVQALTGPILEPQLGLNNNLGLRYAGQVSELLAVGAGGTVMVPQPPTGFVVRVRYWGIRAAVAPAAGGQVHLRGTISGTNYASWEAPGALPVDAEIPLDIIIAGSPRTDPVEGLTLVNSSGVAISSQVDYDVQPFQIVTP